MQKLLFLSAFLAVVIASCNSGSGKEKVKEPVAAVTQTVQNDTVVTIYQGVRPCRGCKGIGTEIKFIRSVKDTVGRFYLSEAYVNKKDSTFQHYEGAGNYKIMPAANGQVDGVALYNMVLDDQTHGYLYLLEDSVTLVRVDKNGKQVTGDDAAVLKRSK